MDTIFYASLCALAVAVCASGFVHTDLNDLTEMKALLGSGTGHGERTVREVAGPDDSHHHHHHRHHHRRHMHPPYKYCCGGENNTDYSAQRVVRRVAMGCIEKLETKTSEWSRFGNPTKDPFTCDRMIKFKSFIFCINDCIMKEHGALNEDGIVQTEKAKEYITKDLAFDWLKELASDAVEKCVSQKGHVWIKHEDKLECSAVAINFQHCVWNEIIMTCPEEELVKNDYCTRVKEAFEDIEG